MPLPYRGLSRVAAKWPNYFFFGEVLKKVTSKEFERLLATTSPFGATAIDQTARSLRPAGLLPVGGRGFAAVDIEPRHAANMLIGLTAAKHPGAAAYAVVAYRVLPTADGTAFEGHQNFGDALSAVLASTELASRIRCVLISKSHPLAFIDYLDGKNVLFGDESIHLSCKFRVEVWIGGAVLQHISSHIISSSGRS